jgi:hypothetical protein
VPPAGSAPAGAAAQPQQPAQRRTLLIVVGLLVLVLAAIAAVQLLSGGDDNGGAGGGGGDPTATRGATATPTEQQGIVLPGSTLTPTSTLPPTSTATASPEPTFTPTASPTLPPTFTPRPVVTATFTPSATPTETPTPLPSVPAGGDILNQRVPPDATGEPLADGSAWFAQGGAEHLTAPAGANGIYLEPEFVAPADSSITIELQMPRGGASSVACLYRIYATAAAEQWTGVRFCLSGNGSVFAQDVNADHTTLNNLPLNAQTVNPAVLNALAIVTQGNTAYFVVNGVLLGTVQLSEVADGRMRYAVLNSLGEADAEFVFTNLTVRALAT